MDGGDDLDPRQRLGAGRRTLGRAAAQGQQDLRGGSLRAREYEARDGQKRTALELRFARVVNLERRPRDEDGGTGGGGAYDDAPPQVRPRGAGQPEPQPQRSSAPGAEMDVDDIPF